VGHKIYFETLGYAWEHAVRTSTLCFHCTPSWRGQEWLYLYLHLYLV